MIGTYAAQDVWWQQRTGADKNGQPVFAAAQKLKGRWVEKRKLVRAQNGEQVISEVTVTLAPTPEVKAGDRLSKDGTAYLVIITASAGVSLGGTVELRRAYA